MNIYDYETFSITKETNSEIIMSYELSNHHSWARGALVPQAKTLTLLVYRPRLLAESIYIYNCCHFKDVTSTIKIFKVQII